MLTQRIQRAISTKSIHSDDADLNSPLTTPRDAFAAIIDHNSIIQLQSVIRQYITPTTSSAPTTTDTALTTATQSKSSTDALTDVFGNDDTTSTTTHTKRALETILSEYDSGAQGVINLTSSTPYTTTTAGLIQQLITTNKAILAEITLTEKTSQTLRSPPSNASVTERQVYDTEQWILNDKIETLTAQYEENEAEIKKLSQI